MIIFSFHRSAGNLDGFQTAIKTFYNNLSLLWLK